MTIIRLETYIDAPVEECFDLSLSVDLHSQSMGHTQEKPIAGVMSGIMKHGDEVTWEAVHFGIRQHLTSVIADYQAPYFFIDEMTRGIFQSLKHLHIFTPLASGTLMKDILYFQAPRASLGFVAEKLFLAYYMRNLLQSRNQFLKDTAERTYIALNQTS